jgi:uncharacterized protein (TIGR02001 family)
LLLVAALLPLGAVAQTTASIAWMSDYRVRGVSLDGGRPSAQLSVDHDTSFGLYGGATMARARLPNTGADALATAYAGYAHRAVADLTWEAGAARTMFRAGRDYDYTEWYAGLARPDLNARLYWSPRYFGVAGASWYGEANAVVALARTLDLQLHAGVLRAQDGHTNLNGYEARVWHGPARADVRIGLTWTAGPRSAWLAWTATHGDEAVYGRASGGGRRLAAGIRYIF